MFVSVCLWQLNEKSFLTTRMDFIFDCFFEEVLETIERSGLKTRQNRQNVIEQLDAIITGCSSGNSKLKISWNPFVPTTLSTGQDIPEVEVCIIAIESLVKYHRTMKSQNAEVRMEKYFAYKIVLNRPSISELMRLKNIYHSDLQNGEISQSAIYWIKNCMELERHSFGHYLHSAQ